MASVAQVRWDCRCRVSSCGWQFDFVYAYDLIQQLPRALQPLACAAMIRHVAPGGLLVLIDQERWSYSGVSRQVKKWITRVSGLGLMPRFYGVARYPDLRSIERILRESGLIVDRVSIPSFPRTAIRGRRPTPSSRSVARQ